MFTSVSLATPNSIVTSSFTTSEACVIDFSQPLTVRVNGLLVTSRPISLQINDTIEVDVLSPEAGQTSFVQWNRNGITSYFAIASANPSSSPILRSQFVNKPWYDYEPTLADASWFKSSITEFQVTTSGTQNTGSLTSEVFVCHRASGPGLVLYDTNGNFISSLYASEGTVGSTKVWNSASQNWELWVLTQTGRVDKISPDQTVTQGSTYTNAKCIFSDGSSVFLGGPQLLVTLSDINTVSRTYSTTETILSGAGTGPLVVVSTLSGKLMKLTSNTLTTIYQGTMLGEIASFKRNILVPEPQKYKVKVFDIFGQLTREINTGSRLPWVIGASKSGFSVGSFESNELMLFSSISSEPTIQSFGRNITWSTPTSPSSTIASSYFREFNTLTTSNPDVLGVTSSYWKVPANVDTGSGDFLLETDGDSLAIRSSPGLTTLVNGLTSTTVNNGQKISCMTRSSLGKKSLAFSVGNYAFDFVVEGIVTTDKIRHIDIPHSTLSSQITLIFTVPAEASNEVIALSYGSLLVNGNQYNGSSGVSQNDVLTISMLLPAGSTSLYSMLSIGDSQFAILANNNPFSIVETISGVTTNDTTLKSTYQVTESGIYNFPNYTNALVKKNGSTVVFPATFSSGDSLEITHTKQSGITSDIRDTVLIGPNTNFVFQGVTSVDEIPDITNFGTILDGIPDFEIASDIAVTITGMSPGYSAAIFGDYMRFSVNGSQPIEQPVIQNGDIVRVYFTVQNLWQSSTNFIVENPKVKMQTLTQGIVEIGEITIEPALGGTFVGTNALLTPESQWTTWGEEPSQAQLSIAVFESHDSLTSLSSIGELVSNLELQTDAYQGFWIGAPTIGQTQTNDASEEARSSFGTTAVPSSKVYSYNTYASKDVSDNWLGVNNRGVYANAPKVSWLSGVNPTNNAWNPRPYALESNVYQIFEKVWIEFKNTQLFHFNKVWFKDQREEFRHVDLVWSALAPVEGIVFDPKPQHQASNYFDTSFTVTTLFAYLHWERIFTFDSVSGVDPKTSTPQIEINPTAIKSETLASIETNPDVDVPVSNIETAGPNAFSAADLLWNTFLPLETGGFVDSQSALEGASVYVDSGFDVTTYQQIEGTFSYIVSLNTGLVCETTPTTLKSIKWLIGGG